MLRRLLFVLLALLLLAPLLEGPASASGSGAPSIASTAPSPAVVAVDVQARDNGACALMSNATVRCWGRNTFGQVGDGSTDDRWSPVAVPGLAGVASLSVGTDHACAVMANGRVRCWGSNVFGQSGGPLGASTYAVPTEVPGLTDVVSVSAGFEHSCAVRANGTLSCWGANGFGQTGTGAAFAQWGPASVPGIAGVAQVDAGVYNTCALLVDRTVRCWGVGGRNGDGTDVGRPSPTAVSGLTDIKQIALGGEHACALRVEGTVWCWGNNGSYQMGDGTWEQRLVPVQVVGVSHAASISSAGSHSCAALSNGGVRCWGSNSLRQLGDGTDQQRPTSVAVVGLDHVRSLAVVGSTTCALRTGGSVRCWGANFQGQVGDGTNVPRPAPTPTVGLGGQGHWPFASWNAQVDRLFLDALGRLPASWERSQYASGLQSGTLTPGQAAANLRTQPDNVNAVDPGVRLYRAFLGRAPDAGGLRFWIDRRRTGSWTLVRMADHFAGSSEFVRKYGSLTNRQFVTRIYTDVLGRTADPSGVDYWTRQLDQRRRGRGAVMVGFSESNEYKRKQEHNTDLAVAYIFHLGRSPNGSETHDWLTRRNAGVAQADLLDELLGSRGYARRIGA